MENEVDIAKYAADGKADNLRTETILKEAILE